MATFRMLINVNKIEVNKSAKQKHLKTFLNIHTLTIKNIFKHLHSSETCFDSYNSLCFKIIDKANSKFDLKMKEALHINWRKPNLNAQQNHLALTISL